MPFSAGRMLASKVAYSALNSAGKIYPSLLTFLSKNQQNACGNDCTANIPVSAK